MALTPEILIPRLGDVLVEQGLITQDQLLSALESQKEMRLEGKSLLLGQVMIAMGFLDQNTLDQAITKQIMLLQAGLQQANETLEKRVQERTIELETAYKKLSVLTELKANFVSNISHELRTPLTHINGYLDLFQTNGMDNLTLEQKETINVIRRAGSRLENLINDLILFSTSEVGSITLQKEIFSLTSLIQEVIDKNQAIAKKKNIQIATSSLIQPIKVMADRAKIFWVLNQLIDNAIKFSSNEGRITVSSTITGKKVKIDVSDVGIGIQFEKTDEIFEPFHQLDSSSTRKQGGTGLGLALVKKILEAHNQKIEVISSPGKGSSFIFNLDLASNSD